MFVIQKKRIMWKKGTMWLTKAMFFFLSFFFVARQKTGKLVTRDSSCTDMHIVHFLSGPMLKIVLYFFLICILCVWIRANKSFFFYFIFNYVIQTMTWWFGRTSRFYWFACSILNRPQAERGSILILWTKNVELLSNYNVTFLGLLI